MVTVLLALTAIVCAVGWLANHVTAMALLLYMINRGYPTPSRDEMKESAEEIVERWFSRKNR